MQSQRQLLYNRRAYNRQKITYQPEELVITKDYEFDETIGNRWRLSSNLVNYDLVMCWRNDFLDKMVFPNLLRIKIRFLGSLTDPKRIHQFLTRLYRGAPDLNQLEIDQIELHCHFKFAFDSLLLLHIGRIENPNGKKLVLRAARLDALCLRKYRFQMESIHFVFF